MASAPEALLMVLIMRTSSRELVAWACEADPTSPVVREAGLIAAAVLT